MARVRRISKYLPVVMGKKAVVDNFTSDFEDAALAGWTAADGTISQQTANRPGSAGTHCMRLTDTGAILYPCAWRFNTAVKPYHWYKLDGWIVKRTAPGSCGTDVRDDATHNTQRATWAGCWTANTWKNVITTFRALNETTEAVHFSTPTTAQNQYAEIDDVVFTPLVLKDLIANTVTATNTVNASAKVKMPAETTALGVYGQAGVVVNLDSASSPNNFVIAYVDWAINGTDHTVVLEKCVNGVWTVVQAATAITYVLDGDIQLKRSGNNYSVYYNGVIVGAAQAITDASIISNTLHGTFCTHGAISHSARSLWWMELERWYLISMY